VSGGRFRARNSAQPMASLWNQTPAVAGWRVAARAGLFVGGRNRFSTSPRLTVAVAINVGSELLMVTRWTDLIAATHSSVSVRESHCLWSFRAAGL
jgi:hypothetical protein